MTDSIAVLEDGYSEVVVNVMPLALNLSCSSSRQCRETTQLVNMMTTNNTLDPLYFVAVFCEGVYSRLVAYSNKL